VTTTTGVRATRRGARASAVVPSDGRAHNLSLVRHTLHLEGAQSRADLSRALGLTKVTVSDLVAELIDLGHVVELGPSGQVRPGKPATMVDLNRTGLQVLALDLAESDVLRAAVLDLDGTVVSALVEDLDPQSGPDDTLAQVLALAERAVDAATAPVIGVGVGSPGIVTAEGVVATAPNLGWRDVPLQQRLEERTGLPTLVSNDADAAVQAEHAAGGAEDLMLVKVGRGVGAGLVVGGQWTRGSRHAAGEIGHVTVGTHGGPTCRCGRDGCLETWLAVPALEAALAATDAADGPAAGRDAVLTEAGVRLGIVLAPLVAALDLAEVVVCGRIDLVGGALLDATRQTLADRILAVGPEPTLVVRGADDPDGIVLRGAAAMVLRTRLGLL
jgi:predicted NBD/HSP70 family sugar kinase